MSIGSYVGKPEVMRILVEGRHFCFNCGKLIREGQIFISKGSPAPFRRMMKISYKHDKC